VCGNVNEKLTPLSDTERSTELPRRISRVHCVAAFVFWAWVPMPEWEYVTISLSNLPVKPRPVDVLNDAGGQGWQLVAITTNNICVPEAAGPETTLTTEAADSNARPVITNASVIHL
jgi:hypothetical protein